MAEVLLELPRLVRGSDDDDTSCEGKPSFLMNARNTGSLMDIAEFVI